jgi:hypothetical protein
VKPQCLDELSQRLRRNGYSARFIERISDELHDHYECRKVDYLVDGCSANEAAVKAANDVGPADALFQEIARREELLPFARRRPLVAFLLAPLPTLAGSVGAFLLLGAIVFLTATRYFQVEQTDPVFRKLVLGAFDVFVYSITPAIALGFCRMALARGCSLCGPLLTCAVLAVIGGSLEIHLVICPASGSLTYFQFFGLNATRLLLPLLVFLIFVPCARLVARYRTDG